MSLPGYFDGSSQQEFFDLSGVTMNGQTISIDFILPVGARLETVGAVWAEIVLQTAPHNPPNPNGDFPYSQYVVFGEGTTAYLLDENGTRLDVPMADWQGGLTTAPALTLPVIHTDHGLAGADMVAFPPHGMKVGGVHYDIVLPNTGESIYVGRISLKADLANPSQAPPAEPSNIISSNIISSEYPLAQPIQPLDGPVATDFAVSDLGATVHAVGGAGLYLSGYGRIEPDKGASPSGLVVLGYRNSGVLVGETIVQDSSLITAGRVHAEVTADGRLTTHVVIANPNLEDATVNFELRDQQGNLSRSGYFTLRGHSAGCNPGNACNQLARFLEQDPFWGGRDVQGTMTLVSSLPVAMFAARWSATGGNPGDVLVTALPVVDLSAAATQETQVIPHFMVGNGRKTELVMVNPTGATLQGVARFVDIYGGNTYLSSDGSNYQSSFQYSIPPNSSQKVIVAKALTGSEFGSVRVTPTDGPAPAPFVIQSYAQAGVTTFDIAVPASMGAAFRMYAEQQPGGQLRTGLAISNNNNFSGTVWVSLSDREGSLVGSTSFSLQAYGQIVDYLDSLIPTVSGQAVQGVVRITTDLPSISVLGLRARRNERQQFLMSAIPPVQEEQLPQSQERFFPYWMNGAGFETQIVLFSGRAGQSASGTLTLIRADGTPVDLGLQ
ncbi:MAG TPA: hypothetical protein VFR18_23630 [Terriglobia bacterium]|nr:hypothetical protein [Terriglobia bacterium]